MFTKHLLHYIDRVHHRGSYTFKLSDAVHVLLIGFNFYNRDCFLTQALDLFCINCLQREVYLKEGDFSNISRYSGYTIFLTSYKFRNLSDTHLYKFFL